MMTVPFISVLMAVYNENNFLSQAIESIKNQTFGDFEFIIVDDGSYDGSSERLKRYATLDSRIRLIAQERQGLTRSLNTGIRLSRGQLIARMDADDVADPIRLQAQVNYLSDHPDVVCLGAQALKIDEDGDPIESWHVPLDHDEILRQLLNGHGGQIIHPLFLIRRDALVKVGGYNESYLLAQDYDLLLRLAEIGSLANLPDVLLGYRIHSAGTTFARRKEQLSYVIKAYLEAHDRRSTPASDLDIPHINCPPSTLVSHIDLARKASGAGFTSSAQKHARQALLGLRSFSRDWLEMKRLSDVNLVKLRFYRAIAPVCRRALTMSESVYRLLILSS